MELEGVFRVGLLGMEEERNKQRVDNGDGEQ